MNQPLKTIPCISCQTEHNDKFCPECGERSGVKKITFRSITEEAISSITNMDKGFLFDCKALLTNPKQLTSAYIKGKRKGILNPISFLIISITIYLIFEAFFKTPATSVDTTDKNVFYNIGQAAGKFISSYYKYFLIFTIFLLANATKLFFGKYNYLEHVAISSFVIGLSVLLSIIPYIFFGVPVIFNPLFYILVFITVHRIFKIGTSKSEDLILSLSSGFVFVLQLFTIMVLIGLLMKYYW